MIGFSTKSTGRESMLFVVILVHPQPAAPCEALHRLGSWSKDRLVIPLSTSILTYTGMQAGNRMSKVFLFTAFDHAEA